MTPIALLIMCSGAQGSQLFTLSPGSAGLMPVRGGGGLDVGGGSLETSVKRDCVKRSETDRDKEL